MWVNQPTGGSSTNEENAGPNSSNVLAKDYRTNCNISRTYTPGTSQNPNSSTTWATHPAFTWQYTKEANGFDKTIELNGLWVGKYETTGTRTFPTVKPNQHANISEPIGNFYTAAKHIGVYDPNNVGGNNVTGTDGTTLSASDNWNSLHNLNTATSHMLKNSEWGAITYLAHSAYGAGINDSYTRKTNVNKNGAYPDGSADADDTSSRYGITGCGPVSAGSTDYYPNNGNVPAGTPLDENTIESPTACSTNTDYAYNGNLGVLASTTNNVYGVYDTSGGATEYVVGSTTSDPTKTSGGSANMTISAVQPYANLYVTSPQGPFNSKPSWSADSRPELYNNDVCTFETCGGSATYEINVLQSISNYRQSWGNSHPGFVNSGNNSWFDRGSYSNNDISSPFYHGYNSNNGRLIIGSRSALLVQSAGE